MPVSASIEIAPGVHMPRIGLGTHRIGGDVLVRCVHAAMDAIGDAGVLHVDTASCYNNEAAVGDAIESSSFPRERVFITSKIAPKEMGREKTPRAIDGMLSRLRVDALDLLLVHWPAAAKVSPDDRAAHRVARRETWDAMERALAAGKCRAIGVSNYTIDHMTELLSHASVKPAVNQIEFHPRCPQREASAFCRERDIAVVAYSPLGVGALIDDAAVKRAAMAFRCAPATCLIAWALRRGVAVLPKSATPERAKENASLERASDVVDRMDAAAGAVGGGGEARDALEAMDAMGDGDGAEKYCWDPSVVR